MYKNIHQLPENINNINLLIQELKKGEISTTRA